MHVSKSNVVVTWLDNPAVRSFHPQHQAFGLVPS